MRSIEKRIEIIETTLGKHLHDYSSHVVEFKSRGKNHDENARLMREFAEEHNRLATEQAITKSIVDQLTVGIKELRNDLRVELRALGEKVVDVKQSFDRISTRDTTIGWLLKMAFRALATAITMMVGIMTALKYMGY